MSTPYLPRGAYPCRPGYGIDPSTGRLLTRKQSEERTAANLRKLAEIRASIDRSLEKQDRVMKELRSKDGAV